VLLAEVVDDGGGTALGRAATPGAPAGGADRAGSVAGCVAMRPLSPGVCEMKRLYVKPQYRGLGVGLRLSRAIIQKARDRGYKSMRLDTVASMVEATRMYEALGFREIAPYRHNPRPDARFFELDLRS
jgi:ribosomal protein S18 acetylase RimI-like enzyme